MRRVSDLFKDSQIPLPFFRSAHKGQTEKPSDCHLADHPALFSDARSKSRLARFYEAHWKDRPAHTPEASPKDLSAHTSGYAPETRSPGHQTGLWRSIKEGLFSMDRPIRLPSKNTLGRAVIVSELFLFSFLVGNLAAYVVAVRSGQGTSRHLDPRSVPLSQEAASYPGQPGAQNSPDSQNMSNARNTSGTQNVSSGQTILYASDEGNWGLSFQQEGKPPVANASMDYLQQFDAYYAQDTEDKVLYLTFDAGYEDGNTAAILDALKKHNAPATFFLVGNYLETSPDLVKRMVAEGHNVGNHTYHHPDMSKISTKETFSKELTDLEALYEQVTGQPMKKYYRPPQGKYSEANLAMAKEMGYKTFFWSLAYVDWYKDKQPTKEEAFKKLLGRIHPGAIVLLHSTSKTNGEILDELLGKWEEMGYHFAPLDDLVGAPDGQ